MVGAGGDGDTEHAGRLKGVELGEGAIVAALHGGLMMEDFTQVVVVHRGDKGALEALGGGELVGPHLQGVVEGVVARRSALMTAASTTAARLVRQRETAARSAMLVS